MRESKFVFNEAMGSLLKSMREKAGLFQGDIANALGFKSRTSFTYISRLEKGLIRNPSMRTIIMYLNACGGDRLRFFTELNKILIKQEQEQVMSEIKLSYKDAKKRVGYKTLIQKLDRDTALYANKIKNIARPIDKYTLKDRIERKVRMLLVNHKIEEVLIPVYLDYTYKLYEQEIANSVLSSIDEKQFIKPGIRPILFGPIRKIVYQTIKTEKRRLQHTRPYSTEKQKKLAIGFLKYRVVIEQIELAVHQLLNDLQVKEVLYLAYKDYARACYSVLKKYYHKDQTLLSRRLTEITRSFKTKGLDEEVMEKVKETVSIDYTRLL